MNDGVAIAVIIAIAIGLSEPMLFIPILVLCLICAAINEATRG